MEAKPSHTSISSPEDPKQQISSQQESSNSHPSPSQSSQTYTNIPSGTGGSAQSATVTTENFDPIAYEAAFAHHMQALPRLSADEQELSLVGSWAAGVDPHTVLIENDPILSPIHRVGPVVVPARQGTETTDRNGNENTDEAVGVLRASLHRKV